MNPRLAIGGCVKCGVACMTAWLVLAVGCAAPSHFEAPGTTHGPNCPSIDAARAIDFSGDRARAFSRIARQPELSPHELAFLAEAATDGRLFSGDAAGVLVLVARHPNAADQTRRTVSERLGKLDLFSADRARVAAALAVPPASEGEPPRQP